MTAGLVYRNDHPYMLCSICRRNLEQEKYFWEELLFRRTKFCLLICIQTASSSQKYNKVTVILNGVK
jgi:hypothetical protein